MNQLSIERQAQIIKVLCEGNSIRSTARITDTAINTVVKLLKDVGIACLNYQDKNIKNLNTKRIECDEIWSFCYAKEENLPADIKDKFGYGDVWTFVAIDADSKLIVSWLVGERQIEYAQGFINDIKERIVNRIQLTADGHRVYLDTIENAFHADIDYAILVKHYGSTIGNEKDIRYSSARARKISARRINGNSDMKKVSASYVERQNLSMRMGMRRFTRLTNGFSKKVENQIYATALYFQYYNFVRTHKTLVTPCPRTPAMVAGLSDHIWSCGEIVN